VSNKKYQVKNRKFHFYWEERYSFANNNRKPQCLVRLQVISVPKEFLYEEELQHQIRENIRDILQKF